MGLSVAQSKAGPDGGIDIVAESFEPIVGGRMIIQCKRYTGSVSEPTIRDLFGVVHSERATKGILITTGTLTGPARAFAEQKPLELIDGSQLRSLLQKHLPRWSMDHRIPVDEEEAASRGFYALV